ncbi:dihydrolipoamide acetyltransferase family protein [Nitrospira defluvii]|uniref:Dihydrolipoamide acetyltransferase component of pyruvate dehydrogenase complex n=1 Tax=Nitrospira defluvii TaxID=330214 RepID=A0ABM8RND6_9BACT|nr:dihydrolipoamide acetyltransferase family protein [Nitrospira defluvii]CAE6762436.1 Dihydrolipoyllysine-residue acetyltransferase component of pyruvate dehydrogenase complex [Nitrospira defluvii]
MASRVVMPKLTDTMEEGVLLAWKKREGEQVHAGEVIAEIETDKAVMDLEAFAPGLLRKILVREGETVASGTLIAVIAEADEDIASALSDGVTAAPSIGLGPKPASPAGTASPTSPGRSGGERVLASPRAKALAAERGIELSTLTGTGPGGRIVEDDVAVASAPVAQALPVGTDQPLSQMRKAIARATVQSKAPVPHFYLTVEIDMAQAERVRDEFKQSRQPHPSITDVLIKAAALALKRHPEVNVSFAGEAIRRYTQIDIGVAVGMEDGLITPVVRNCGAKTLAEISVETKQLIDRARQKRLSPQEYTGATFAISNLGMFDVDQFIALLMPPQAASIAVGAIRDVPIVAKGVVTVGRRMKVTLSCDHRALDGLMGAQFLKEFKRVLEHPQEWLTPVVTS